MHVFDLLVCCIVILCALTNVLKLIACRVDAYSERESIFPGCLAPVTRASTEKAPAGRSASHNAVDR